MPYRMRRFFVRLTQPSFTVSAGAIVFDSGGRVLLLRHVLRPDKSGWGIPGGFLAKGEQPEDAVKRELCEEAGVNIENLQFLKIRTNGQHVEVIYRAEAKNTDARPKSLEITEARWFQIEQLPDLSKRERELFTLARKVGEKRRD